MISKPLFKATIKQNIFVFTLILVVLMIYLPIIIMLYEPATKESLNDVLAVMPEGLIAAMGLNNLGSTLTDFIGNYFYGFLILLLPMIYTITVCNRSIASLVDKGSMAYLLSTPNKRTKIALTQAVFIIASITAMIAFVTIAGIAISNITFPGELDISAFLLLNTGALILFYAITGIGFFSSCLFNDAKNSLMVGAGLPVLFLVVQMISDIDEKVHFFKYFTLFTLYDPEKIIHNGIFLPQFIILFSMAFIMYGLAIYVFDKKDLPI